MGELSVPPAAGDTPGSRAPPRETPCAEALLCSDMRHTEVGLHPSLEELRSEKDTQYKCGETPHMYELMRATSVSSEI